MAKDQANPLSDARNAIRDCRSALDSIDGLLVRAKLSPEAAADLSDTLHDLAGELGVLSRDLLRQALAAGRPKRRRVHHATDADDD